MEHSIEIKPKMETNVEKKHKIPTVFKVAGVSFYKENVKILSQDEILKLELDPCNEYDSNAIKVLNSNGKMIGHVPKEFNIGLCKKFDKIQQKYVLKVKNIHKWEGPTGLEVEFTKKKLFICN